MTVEERDWLAKVFEQNRSHLRTVAHRMLGSASEADDAVQEAWLRLGRAETSGVANLTGWLTTVVARICLDVLRSRKAHVEEPLDANTSAALGDDASDPEQEALLGDSVGLALLVVLETLDPVERVAFVLHDMFAVPFEEIAPIVGRSAVAARQLASRARRRVQGGAAVGSDAELGRRRAIVDAFFAASRESDFDALLAVLDGDVVLRADEEAVRIGASSMGLAREIRGAKAVANVFKGRARGARPALVDGDAAAVWAPAGEPRSVFRFTIVGAKIVAIELIASPTSLAKLDLEVT